MRCWMAFQSLADSPLACLLQSIINWQVERYSVIASTSSRDRSRYSAEISRDELIIEVSPSGETVDESNESSRYEIRD